MIYTSQLGPAFTKTVQNEILHIQHADRNYAILLYTLINWYYFSAYFTIWFNDFWATVIFLHIPIHCFPILLISHGPRTLPTWMTCKWIDCIVQRAVSMQQSFRLLGRDQRYSLNDSFCENNSKSRMFPIAVLMKWLCPGHVKMAGFGKGKGEVYVLSSQTSERFPAIITVLSNVVLFALPRRVWRSTPVWFSVVIPLISCYFCHIGAKTLRR